MAAPVSRPLFCSILSNTVSHCCAWQGINHSSVFHLSDYLAKTVSRNFNLLNNQKEFPHRVHHNLEYHDYLNRPSIIKDLKFYYLQTPSVSCSWYLFYSWSYYKISLSIISMNGVQMFELIEATATCGQSVWCWLFKMYTVHHYPSMQYYIFLWLTLHSYTN